MYLLRWHTSAADARRGTQLHGSHFRLWNQTPMAALSRRNSSRDDAFVVNSPRPYEKPSLTARRVSTTLCVPAIPAAARDHVALVGPHMPARVSYVKRRLTPRPPHYGELSQLLRKRSRPPAVGHGDRRRLLMESHFGGGRPRRSPSQPLAPTADLALFRGHLRALRDDGGDWNMR